MHEGQSNIHSFTSNSDSMISNLNAEHSMFCLIFRPSMPLVQSPRPTRKKGFFFLWIQFHYPHTRQPTPRCVSSAASAFDGIVRWMWEQRQYIQYFANLFWLNHYFLPNIVITQTKWNRSTVAICIGFGWNHTNDVNKLNITENRSEMGREERDSER